MDQRVESILTPDIVRMLVASMTQDGSAPLSEIAAERFLNALARARLGVPTGPQTPNGERQ